MMNLNLMDTAEIVRYLDDLPCWDDDNVEPMLQELCWRLGIDYNSYLDDYGVIQIEDAFDAILAAA